MRSSACVALVVLLALSSTALAQLPSIVTLAPFIGRGFDIVTERIKAPLAQWTYYDQFTMMWNGQEYLSAHTQTHLPLVWLLLGFILA